MSGRDVPVLPGPAEAAGYISRWRPSSVSPGAASFARQVVAASGPHGRDRAKNLHWAAGKLAGYGTGLGLDPVPEVLLHPSLVERLTAHAPGPTGAARRAHRDRPRRRAGGGAGGVGPLPPAAAGVRAVRRDPPGHRRHRPGAAQHHQPAGPVAGRRDRAAAAGHEPAPGHLAGRSRRPAPPARLHAPSPPPHPPTPPPPPPSPPSPQPPPA